MSRNGQRIWKPIKKLARKEKTVEIVQRIQIDLSARSLSPEISVKQGDNAVQIQALLFNGNIPFTPSGNVYVYVRKPDGKLVFNGCTIAEEKIIVQTTTQMTAVDGSASVELAMKDGDKVLSTPLFRMKILPKVSDGTEVESTDEFGALLSAVQEMEDALQSVEDLKKTGLKGDKGDRSTIKIGKVTASDPGGEAKVTNSGTNTDAIFDFVIPKGEQGPPGDKGEPGGDAVNTNFDDTTTGLGAANVQEAIELLARSISRAIIVSSKS